jgi:hypothetical protein
VLHAGVRSQFGFERLAFLTQDINPGTKGTQSGFFNLGTDKTFGE